VRVFVAALGGEPERRAAPGALEIGPAELSRRARDVGEARLVRAAPADERAVAGGLAAPELVDNAPQPLEGCSAAAHSAAAAASMAIEPAADSHASCASYPPNDASAGWHARGWKSGPARASSFGSHRTRRSQRAARAAAKSASGVADERRSSSSPQPPKPAHLRRPRRREPREAASGTAGGGRSRLARIGRVWPQRAAGHAQSARRASGAQARGLPRARETH
jgi:hypothetical protein